MRKVDEKVDLSKKVLDIQIDSPIFEQMLNELNAEIGRSIKKVYDNDFVGGDVTLKISLEVPESYKNFPCTDPVTGELINRTYMYRQLRFKYKVTNVLKKQFVQEGEFMEERELKEQADGSFVAVPLDNPQLSMLDEE